MHLWDDYIQMQKQALYCLHDDICQCIHLKCAIYSPRTLGRATVDNASRETTALRANIALTLCVHATIAKLYKSSLELEWFREHVMSTWDWGTRWTIPNLHASLPPEWENRLDDDAHQCEGSKNAVLLQGKRIWKCGIIPRQTHVQHWAPGSNSSFRGNQIISPWRQTVYRQVGTKQQANTQVNFTTAQTKLSNQLHLT